MYPMNPLRNITGPDIDVGRANLDEIKRMGLFPLNCLDEDVRWITPKNLAMRTMGPNAEYEIVYHQYSTRERRRIVRFASNDRVDSVLCVKTSSEPEQ